MANEMPAASLLEELDTRQNALLDELERLNSQIERVIAEWTTSRPQMAEDVSRRQAA
jgi:hypothetical protein